MQSSKTKSPARASAAFEPVEGGVTAASGFFAAGVKAGIKVSKKPDLAVVFSDRPAAGAGMFTTNAIRASCVDYNASALPSPSVRAFVCNSGNANACTGKRGEKDTRDMALAAADALKVPGGSVLVASTGVIGKYLPMDGIRAALPKAVASLSTSGGGAFAEAVMTTDLVKKEYAVRVTCGGRSFTIGAAAKGSGMIHPNMATMLCFITTDAEVDAASLHAALKRAVDGTFNNLTVDGDTSTNDMALVMANGASGVSVPRAGALRKAFGEGLRLVCGEMCKRIAADGEGATKRVEVNVTGARTGADAKRAAKAVAASNLTKCALFGNDPNWGRIACAVGYSGAKFDKNRLTVDLCGVRVFEKTQPADFDAAKVHKLMKEKVVTIDIDLREGSGAATVQTCDFSYDYVKINAEYHT